MPVTPEHIAEGNREEPDFRRWIIIHRMPFWIYIRIKRPYKELFKTLLFTLAPVFFRHRIEYRHWKDARIFRGSQYKIWTPAFWSSVWKNADSLSLPAPSGKGSKDTKTPLRLAVVVHAFYPEILEEILEKIGTPPGVAPSLFVTCTPDKESDISTILARQPHPFIVKVVENRGRDVLPFLKILPDIQRQGYEIVLKLHTKKSSHLMHNTYWKEDIFSHLLAPGKIKACSHLLCHNPEVGLIGPKGHILPMAMYYSNNARRVGDLCAAMHLSKHEMTRLYFIAGTMFYARIEALIPLMHLPLCNNDFEQEEGQVDGTMAHAVERAIAASALKAGLLLVDTESTEDRFICTAVPHYTFSI